LAAKLRGVLDRDFNNAWPKNQKRTVVNYNLRVHYTNDQRGIAFGARRATIYKYRARNW